MLTYRLSLIVNGFVITLPIRIGCPIVREKKWIVLMRDKAIGKRYLELNALLRSKVKAFVLVTGELSEQVSAEIIKKAVPKIVVMIEQNDFPFIAKIHKNSAVELWRTKMFTIKGIQLR